MTLTDAGQALLPEARATLAAAEAAADAVAETRAALRGTLTIGTMLSTAQVDLPALIARFHAEHPGVVVRTRILPGGSSDLAREVAAGGLDLAVLSVPGDPPAGLALRPLSEEPLVLVCHPGHRLAGTSARPRRPPGSAACPGATCPPGWCGRYRWPRPPPAAHPPPHGRSSLICAADERVREALSPARHGPRECPG